MDEKNHDADGGAGLGRDEERTAVIVRRITRDEVSKGIKLLAAACGGFRARLYDGATHVDAGTEAGYQALTAAEAEDLDADLEDIEVMARNTRAALNRAVGPAPKDDPGEADADTGT
jgi:hypothetical protein